MLHVTNGDSAAAHLRAAGIDGDLLPWRDVLHEGPIAAGPDERARFLAATHAHLDAARIARELHARDERLARAVEAQEPIVCWFEADLYDVLQMLQVLDRVEEARLVMVGADDYRLLTQVDRAEIPALLEAAEPVTPSQLGLVSLAWRAVCDPDPHAVEDLLATGAADALPGLALALRRLLEQLPWTTDGLNRSERALLQAVRDGATTRGDAFVAAQRQEERPFLGDATAFAYLDRLAPVLVGPPLKLTARGEDLLDGRAVFDVRRTLWRWDPAGAKVMHRDEE